MKRDCKQRVLLFSGLLMLLGVFALNPTASILTTVSGSPVTLDQLKPDKVLFNGKIVTVDKDFSVVEAVAIKDGKFVAVGSNAEIRALIGPQTEEIDLEGKTVLPGFIDPHVHFAHKVGRIEDEYEELFSQARSIEEVRRAVQLKVAQTPRGGDRLVFQGTLSKEHGNRPVAQPLRSGSGVARSSCHLGVCFGPCDGGQQ